MSSTLQFYLIGIGASAGGIEPLKSLISLIPYNINAAFIVVQHLLATHHSRLDEILSRVTKLPVIRINGGERVEAGIIYVLPENKLVTIKEGRLSLRKRLPEEVVNYAIDIFFESLGKDAGCRSIGIVLSGANEDGAKGAKVISENGGKVFVQDPNTAEYPRMPAAVIRLDSPAEINEPKKLVNAVVGMVNK